MDSCSRPDWSRPRPSPRFRRERIPTPQQWAARTVGHLHAHGQERRCDDGDRRTGQRRAQRLGSKRQRHVDPRRGSSSSKLPNERDRGSVRRSRIRRTSRTQPHQSPTSTARARRSICRRVPDILWWPISALFRAFAASGADARLERRPVSRHRSRTRTFGDAGSRQFRDTAAPGRCSVNGRGGRVHGRCAVYDLVRPATNLPDEIDVTAQGLTVTRQR